MAYDPWEAVYAEIDEAEAKAKQGDVDAMCHTAFLYNNRADFSSSLAWYKKAAEAGSAEAMCHLGDWQKYHNKKEAYDWYRKAAALGHERAREEFSRLEANIKKLAEIVGEKAVPPELSWKDEGKIAGILNKKFHSIDPLSLSDGQLITKIAETGLPGILPQTGRPGGDEDVMFAIKRAWKQLIEGGDEAARIIVADIAAAKERVEVDGWVFYINSDQSGVFKARPDGSVSIQFPPPPGISETKYRNFRVFVSTVSYDCDGEYEEEKDGARKRIRYTRTYQAVSSRSKAKQGNIEIIEEKENV